MMKKSECCKEALPMTQVYEVLQLEPFHEFQLQAGERGLTNEVTNVTMLDYETDARDYSAFRPGDFILSSLYFAKNDESLILEAFRALVNKGISGFAIKTVYYFTIPDKLQQLADAAGVPVFTFHSTYMEDIIIAVNELMKEKDRQAAQAELLGHLLREPLTESQVSALSHRLDDRMLPWCAAAFATFRDKAGRAPLPTRQTTRWVPMDESGFHYAMFIYRGGALLLLTTPQPLDEGRCRALLLSKLEALRLPPEACRVGFSRTVATRRQLDACVSQALQANRMCRLWQRDWVGYGQLGLYRYLLPLLDAPGCREECRRQLAEVQAYDQEHGTALLDTLTAFVRCGGDVNETARALYQHPNTVRYRVKTVRRLWDDPPAFDQQAFLCVQLEQLAGELEP